MLASRLLSELLDLIAPRDCPACEEPTTRSLCSTCRAELRPAPARELDGVPVLAAGRYAAPLDVAVQRFKYEARPDLAVPLASLVELEALRRLADDPRTLFVPVPLHRTRLSERGYDQSALLARELARRAARRASARALLRVRATEQQARLGESERRANVAGAFTANPRASLASSSVILVDDVVTTGFTVSACRTALAAARARVVGVVCIALGAA